MDKVHIWKGRPQKVEVIYLQGGKGDRHFRMSVTLWVAVGDSRNNRVRIGVGYGMVRTYFLVLFIRGSGFRDITLDGPHPVVIGSLAYSWNLLFFSAADQQPCHTVLAKQDCLQAQGWMG